MKKGILALSVLFLLTSCSLKPLPGQKIAFVDEGFKAPKNMSSVNCKINVDYLNCNNAFDSYTVYVQTGKNQLEPLSNYEWIDTPCEMVKGSIQNALNNSNCSIDLGARNKLLFDLIKFQPILLRNKHFCEVKIGFRLYTNSGQYFTIIDKKENLKSINLFASCISRLVDRIDRELVKWIKGKIEPTKRQAQK